MVLIISLVFVAAFITGYFAGGIINKLKKKKANGAGEKTTVTPLEVLEENKKKEFLN